MRCCLWHSPMQAIHQYCVVSQTNALKQNGQREMSATLALSALHKWGPSRMGSIYFCHFLFLQGLSNRIHCFGVENGKVVWPMHCKSQLDLHFGASARAFAKNENICNTYVSAMFIWVVWVHVAIVYVCEHVSIVSFCCSGLSGVRLFMSLYISEHNTGQWKLISIFMY